jgi:antitoxin VapB
MPDDRVRTEGGFLLKPLATDLDAWFKELDRFAAVPFMEDGRRQPPMPKAESQEREFVVAPPAWLLPPAP